MSAVLIPDILIAPHANLACFDRLFKSLISRQFFATVIDIYRVLPQVFGIYNEDQISCDSTPEMICRPGRIGWHPLTMAEKPTDGIDQKLQFCLLSPRNFGGCQTF